MLLQATSEQVATAVDVLDDLAELRRPHDPAVFLTRLSPAEQRDWLGESLVRAAQVQRLMR